METSRFTRLTRAISTVHSRRTLAGGLGLGALARSGLTAAKKKHKHRRKKKKKATFNAFGCVDFGGFCKNDSQCCSGICEGKSCQAHDVSTCQVGQAEAVCDGVDVLCVAADGGNGFCNTTTGKAPYCRSSGECFDCSKDADCVPFCGPRAACVVCPTLCTVSGLPTVCVGTAGTCTFPAP